MGTAELEKAVRLLATAVEHRREDLNGLNVYPVPDGDTGDNLAALMESVTERLSNTHDVVAAIAAGALHGGRGSSGVIFGQALRGFVMALQSDARDLADALTTAAAAARDAVADPVEGTILTVAADAARRAREVAAGGGSVADVAEAAAQEGRESLDRTPDLLPELAGMIDAGGLGYVLFLDSLVEALTGTARPPVEISGILAPAAAGPPKAAATRSSACSRPALIRSQICANGGCRSATPWPSRAATTPGGATCTPTTSTAHWRPRGRRGRSPTLR
jgi:dihydroxyacetone kinase-like predicted kinase